MADVEILDRRMLCECSMDMLSLQHRGGQKRGLGLKLSDNVFKNQNSVIRLRPIMRLRTLNSYSLSST